MTRPYLSARRLALCWAFIAFVATALACGGAGGPKATTSSAAKAGLDGILADFRSEGFAATPKYKGKSVVAAGEVREAEQSDKKSKGPHVFMKAGEKGDIVAAFFTGRDNTAALALKPGQQATIKGTILNGSRDEKGVVTLAIDDCELVK